MVRDMMVRGYRTFREFQHAGEGIASNILADRLRKLEASGILTTELAVQDGRSAYYLLTAKGIALVHVLLDLLIWGSKHEATAVPCSFIHRWNRIARLCLPRRIGAGCSAIRLR